MVAAFPLIILSLATPLELRFSFLHLDLKPWYKDLNVFISKSYSGAMLLCLYLQKREAPVHPQAYRPSLENKLYWRHFFMHSVSLLLIRQRIKW